MDERLASARLKPASRWSKRVIFGLILALLGTWVSLTLTDFHLSNGKKTQPGIFTTVCEISGGGCSQLLFSSWSTLPGGIPVAFAGLIYFSALSAWYLLVGRANRAGRGWYLLFLALQLAGVAASLFYLGLMLFHLRTLCGWCALAHAINLILAGITWSLRPREPQEYGEAAWPPARLALAVLLLVVMTGAYLERFFVSDFWETEARTYHEDMDLLRYLLVRSQPVDIPLRADDLGRGNDAAPPHTVVIVSDFQCPGCKGFSAFAKENILTSDRVRLIYRHFPVDQSCNAKIPMTAHAQACAAAYAAEAARELGGAPAFWKMHDLLFERQEDVKAGRWAELGTAAGLDGAAVAERVARRAHDDRIQQDIELGHKLKLEVTPAVFVDGRHLKDWGYPELWKALLAAPNPDAAPAPPAAVVAPADHSGHDH